MQLFKTEHNINNNGDKKIIDCYINLEHFEEELGHKLSDEEKLFLGNKLLNFLMMTIPKYLKGSKEHGADLLTMDEDKLREMRQEETIDLWFYEKE